MRDAPDPKRAVHFSAPYFLPSWQGGDTCRPLCIATGTMPAALSLWRAEVTCPICRMILKHGVRHAAVGRVALAARIAAE